MMGCLAFACRWFQRAVGGTVVHGGLQVGAAFSGAVIVEYVFNWPGVGRLTVQAIGWRDYSLLQADVLYIVIAFMAINLLTDLTYGIIDPRIHYQ